MRRDGIALILVAGVLSLLAVLAAAFITLVQLERKAARQRLYTTKARLLARSGFEDALARLGDGQAPEASSNRYRGEDRNDDGVVNAGPEEEGQVYRPSPAGTPADTDACPVRQALRPSFSRRHPSDLDAQGHPAPASIRVEGRERGYSGILGPAATPRETHALKVEDLNGRIHVNDGDLSAANAQDAANDGPNGFLRRLLDNLERVVTGTNASPGRGAQVLAARPAGGYRKLSDLKPVLGQARFDQVSPHLTAQAWVDPKVLKPQPVDARPNRFYGVNDTHRLGNPPAAALASTPATSGDVLGEGTKASPWSQQLTCAAQLDATAYPVRWERDSIYAWRQLRLGPPALEPRAPVAVNGASKEVLASVFLGLKGTYLECWDGSAGFDSGFGYFFDAQGWLDAPIDLGTGLPPPQSDFQGPTYAYPDQATEESPWFRTRVDYGDNYGSLSHPWYGPQGYVAGAVGPVTWCAPLGRLAETAPITLAQAGAIAQALLDRRSQKGSFRTWAEFNAFVDALPLWEDVDGNGALDGPPYIVTSNSTSYTRRTYRREDADSDGILNRRTFSVASGTWSSGDIAWVDLGAGPLGAGDVPGLTFAQKDVLKAMANPNADLNDFNPDQNLFKEVDKSDLGGASTYAHTTELALDSPGFFRVQAAGRILGVDGRLLAEQAFASLVQLWDLHRDTTQADFMRDFNGATPQPISAVFSGPAPAYALAGGQTLVSYPEPQTVGGAPAANAVYDGQIGLGLVGAMAGPGDTLQGDLFDTLNASGSGDAMVPDQPGPFQAALVGTGSALGNLFPDGAYSERDAALKFPMAGNIAPGTTFYIGFWVKPNWLPEASPRPHALLSMSRNTDWGIPTASIPIDNIPVAPIGLYFVPSRNNAWQSGLLGGYDHSSASCLGGTWPRRCLLWGSVHSLYATDTLNVRGMPNVNGPQWGPPAATLPVSQKPVGRLEGHRWAHLGVVARSGWAFPDGNSSFQVLGRAPGSALMTNGGGWNGDLPALFGYLGALHADGSANHLRFGEVAAGCNMNYTADATFANVRAGTGGTSAQCVQYFTGASGPAAYGRYYKEGDYLTPGAVYTSPKLPAAITRPVRITWTEIPCDLWLDGDLDGNNQDGWPGYDADGDGVIDPGEGIRNDQFRSDRTPGANSLRDLRIDLEVWDDTGFRATFSDPAGPNLVPVPVGRLTYKAVFVNEWRDATRLNNPLDVTPFLDDVTILYTPAGGVRILAWGTDTMDD
jgi:hypothetical protein